MIILPKWMRRVSTTPHPVAVSKIQMIRDDLECAEDVVSHLIDEIECITPKCLRGDAVVIRGLSDDLCHAQEVRDSLYKMKYSTIIDELDKFPPYTPCTFDRVITSIGVDGREVRETMLKVEGYEYRQDAEKVHGEFPRKGHDQNISDDSKMLLEHPEWGRHSSRYSRWRLNIIKIPHWRFVVSEYGHVYIERFE